MAIRSGLACVAVLALVLTATQGVALAQGARFVDNGDETLTDKKTGLMWEKKTTAVGSGTSSRDIRDVDNKYAWEYAMHDWLDRLNGRLIAFANDGAFAGHSDWRIPTMQELNTIVDPMAPGRIDAAFGANIPAAYWTSSRRLFGPMVGTTAVPWYVTFGVGDIPVYVGQPFSFHVRAVRNAR